MPLALVHNQNLRSPTNSNIRIYPAQLAWAGYENAQVTCHHCSENRRITRLCRGRYQMSSPDIPNVMSAIAVMSANIVPILQSSQPVLWKMPKI